MIGGLRYRDQRHLLRSCKLRSSRTKYEKRPNSYNGCAAILQIGECAPHCRARIGHIVDNRHASAAKLSSKHFGNPVTGRKKTVLSRPGKPLGIDEFGLEPQSHHQPDKGAFYEWAADNVGSQRRDQGRQFAGSFLHQLRSQAKSLEIEPQISVVT